VLGLEKPTERCPYNPPSPPLPFKAIFSSPFFWPRPRHHWRGAHRRPFFDDKPKTPKKHIDILLVPNIFSSSSFSRLTEVFLGPLDTSSKPSCLQGSFAPDQSFAVFRSFSVVLILTKTIPGILRPDRGLRAFLREVHPFSKPYFSPAYSFCIRPRNSKNLPAPASFIGAKNPSVRVLLPPFASVTRNLLKIVRHFFKSTLESFPLLPTSSQALFFLPLKADWLQFLDDTPFSFF